MLHFSSFSLVTSAIILFTIFSQISAQTFDPNVDDKVYLDAIENRLKQESLSAHLVVVNQSKILQELTRSFIERKLKENFFKVVRQRVEVELEEMARRNISFSGNSTAQPSRLSRQDDNDDDDDATQRPTTPRPRPGLLPQLSNIVSTFFGSDVNVTGYLKDATSFLPGDLSDRIISAASLIDPARFTSTTALPAAGPLIINGQLIPQSAFVNGSYLYSFPSGAQSAVIAQPSAGFVPQGGNYQPIIFNQSSTQNQGGLPQGISQQSSGNFGVAGQQGLVPSVPLAQPGTFQQQNGNFQQQSGNNFQQQPGNNFQQQPGNIFQEQTGNNFQQQPGNNFQQQPGNNFQQQPGNTFQQQPGNNFQQQPGNIQQQPGTFQQPGNFQQQPGNNFQQQPGNFQQRPANFIQEQQQLEFQLNNGINNALNPSQNNALNKPGNNAGNPTSNKPFLNFKVNEAFLPANAGAPPAQSSDEDDEDNNNEESSEDDFEPFPRDDQSNTGIGYIDEFPAVKYVVNIFKRLTNRATVPTTTEYMFMNTTTAGPLDYLDEEEASKQEATSEKSTAMQLLEGGMSLYEGAKEAYQLLQRLNKFLDRVGDRVEDLGYGPEDVGVELS